MTTTWSTGTRTWICMLSAWAFLAILPVDSVFSQQQSRQNPFTNIKWSRSQDEGTVVDRWLRMDPTTKANLARKFVEAPKRKIPGQKQDKIFFAFFREAIKHSPPSDRRPFIRGSRWNRVQRLLWIMNMYAQSQKVLQDIPGVLEEMKKSGHISQEEEKKLLSIQDPRRRTRSFFKLKDTVFLRQMHKVGRISKKTHDHINRIRNSRKRRKELERIHNDGFWKVNAHLIYFMLKPAEQVALKKTRFRFHWEVMQLERKNRIFFLPIFPSKEHSRLSHTLRLTLEQEARLNRRDLTPRDRDKTAGEIYCQQREAFLEELRNRNMETHLRMVSMVKTPQEFYQRAFQVLREMGEFPRRRGDGLSPGAPPGTPGPGFRPNRPGPGLGGGGRPPPRGGKPGPGKFRRK